LLLFPLGTVLRTNRSFCLISWLAPCSGLLCVVVRVAGSSTFVFMSKNNVPRSVRVNALRFIFGFLGSFGIPLFWYFTRELSSGLQCPSGPQHYNMVGISCRSCGKIDRVDSPLSTLFAFVVGGTFGQVFLLGHFICAPLQGHRFIGNGLEADWFFFPSPMTAFFP